MTLNQALAIVNSRKGKREAGTYYLACGFEPLHLATLLRAHLLERLSGDESVDVQCGVYGDLRGNLDAAARTAATGCAAVLEWSDLDPRLGLRSIGGWSNEAKADLATSCLERYTHLEAAIAALAARMPVALASPSLSLPPIGNTIRAQRSALELKLECQLAEFLARIAQVGGVRVVARAPVEAPPGCLDAAMELVAGFPYTVPFASRLAASLVEVLCQPAPKKGLITDLDGTLWAGIAGEVGVESISWSQEHHTQAHGLYQQMLGHLADSGVLLAVCSKNEIATVEAALARKDLFLNAQSFFPVCANWGPKSALVGQILAAWNIAGEAVVFVDDSPMELAEVQQAYPEMTCLGFPAKDPAAVWNLLGHLRDLFGKPVLMEEDRLRQPSIRASAQVREMAGDGGAPDFLRTLQGTVTLAWRVDAADARPLELINKTNQFNLNGHRIRDSEWRCLLERTDTIVAVASYQDKFGPLGKIAVLVGSQAGAKVTVSHWVMSCRAFSRRIEHHMLDGLFRHSNADEIEFDFEKTEKNQPLQEFFKAVSIHPGKDGRFRISRADFLSSCGFLPHQISDQT
ncbi:MAG: HAD-IIIC family phosphatase [Bryobacteraceae bacterium]